MAMAEETLVVSSSTDGQQAVESAAQGTSEGVTVSESSLQDFREQSSDGQTVTSYENPSSERQTLLERVAEAEREIELPEEPADEGQPADESGIDMEAVRQQALADAIEDGRRQHRQAYYEQPPQYSVEAGLQQWRAQQAGPFFERMNELRAQTPDIAELDKQSNIPIPMEVQDTLLGLSARGGPEAALYLMRNPSQARELLQMPLLAAVAKVAQIAGRLDPAARRQRSNAPPPIVPVSGSPTRSSLPPGEMSYSDFSKWRERQIKAKVRR